MFSDRPLSARRARPLRPALPRPHAPRDRPGRSPGGNRMKRHLNTLYVTTQGTYLAKEGEAVVVSLDALVVLRVPIHTLGGIVCFGQIGFSPFLLGLCGERGVAVSFLTENGRFLARLQGPVSGNVLLRREQYRRADDPVASAAVARSVIAGKIANSRTVILRAL